MSDTNKALLRRFYDEVIGQGKLDLIDELISPDFIEHEEFPDLPPGREGVKQVFKMFLEGFPDLHFHVKDMVAEGDKVVARLTMHGTHKGPFMGMPPTGKEVFVQAIDILRFTDGKAVEHWGVTDQMSMMQQLGIHSA